MLETKTGTRGSSKPRAERQTLTVTFQLILGVIAFVEFGFAVVLLEFWPEAFVRRVALLFGGVMRGRDAGAVRGTSRQRFAVSQNVFN